MLTLHPPRIDMDEVCTGWRIALDAVREALEASQRSTPPALPSEELHERTLAVTRERAAVSTILSADARERHVALRRPLDAASGRLRA